MIKFTSLLIMEMTFHDLIFWRHVYNYILSLLGVETSFYFRQQNMDQFVWTPPWTDGNMYPWHNIKDILPTFLGPVK